MERMAGVIVDLDGVSPEPRGLGRMLDAQTPGASPSR
jgi:hypothetical protein